MPLRSLDMTDQDIENALKPGVDGELSLQQLPYDCPDSSFEYTTKDDVLEPVVVHPYEPPTEAKPSDQHLRDQAVGPTRVPNLLDVQSLMPDPKFVNRRRVDLEDLLDSDHIQDPYPYNGNTDILMSYSSEPTRSGKCVNLRHYAKHAVRHWWKYDPIKCSVRGASKPDLKTANRMPHGLTKKEHSWVTGSKLKAMRKSRKSAVIDIEQAVKTSSWMKGSGKNDEVADINQELDQFYGPNGTGLRHNDNSSSGEDFSASDTIAKTMVSSPKVSPTEGRVTPGGIFQDSGAVLDEGYEDDSRAHSAPDTTEEVADHWPSFPVALAPLRVPKANGPRLGLVGDQKQHAWPGRQEAPYDVHDLSFWNCKPEDDQMRNENASEAINADTHDMPEPSTPEPVAQETSGGSAQWMKMENSQHFPRVIGNVDTNVHVPHSTPTIGLYTPLNQRIRQIQQVHVQVPATININLTPERNSDMDAENASTGNLEVRLPYSPTDNTQMGQSALGHFMQESKSRSHPTSQRNSTISLAGRELDDVSLTPTQTRPDPQEGLAVSSNVVELHRKSSDARASLDPSKTSEKMPSSSKTAAMPVTPRFCSESASFQPPTPFQLGTPTRPDFGDPDTPTPVPKTSKANKNSVMNVFRSPKLGSRSPERAEPNPNIIVAPTTPTAGNPRGSCGLLFQQAKKDDKGTQNALNSMQLGADMGSGAASGPDSLEDFEDELAGGGNVEAPLEVVSRGGNRVVADTRPQTAPAAVFGRSTVARAVVVPSVRSRDQEEDGAAHHHQSEAPLLEEDAAPIAAPKQKRRKRSSTKAAAARAKVPDAPGPSATRREGRRW